jgi:hypothetical protein
MPILLARTIEFVHTEQVSTLFTFRLGEVLLYKNYGSLCNAFKNDILYHGQTE